MKLCFVGGGWRTLSGLPDGGSERQIALLASALAARGHSVTLVVPGLRSPSSGPSDVTAIPGWDPSRGWPRGLRLFTSRLPQLRAVLEEVGADCYYSRGFSLFAPSMVAVAGRLRALSVTALACDDDLRYRPLSGGAGGSRSERLGYGILARRYFIAGALRKADLVLAQTSGQREACSSMGIRSEMLGNAFVPPDPAPACDTAVRDAVWLGHLSAFKGVGSLLSLLPMLPGLRIAVAGAVQSAGAAGVPRALRDLGAEYLGEVSHDRAMELLGSSRMLLNTSPAEGFSNAFLEAWFLGRPVVSLLADPDGLLSGPGAAGFCGRGDLAAMAGAVLRLASDGEARRAAGEAGRRRVMSRHMLGAVVDEFERLVRERSDS